MRNKNLFNTPNIKKLPGAGNDTQYPGKSLGFTLEETKKYVQNQIKSIGKTTALAVGPNNEKIQLPGDASIFVGIGFSTPLDAEFTLTINQGIIHENLGVIFATVGNTGGLGIQPYFPVNIPVAGNDTIKLDFNSAVASQIKTLIFYK